MSVKGKYDKQCEQVSRDLGTPEAVLLIVFNNAPPGPGFSVTLRVDAGHLLLRIPDLLRGVAADIENKDPREFLTPIAAIAEEAPQGGPS